MERFNVNKLNDAEVTEQHQDKISHVSLQLWKTLTMTTMMMWTSNRAWESIKI
jgi:hypothetical protein